MKLSSFTHPYVVPKEDILKNR